MERLIAGLDRPSEGSVQVGGRELGRASSRARRLARRSTVGYVFQRPSDNLVPHLTVADHLRLASRRGELTDHEVLSTVDELGLGHRLSHRPDELSGGEQQRAAVAQALASGATLVHTDFPAGEPQFGTGYEVSFPTRVQARCNPVNTTPATCTAAAAVEPAVP